jgi:hypothetical protein
MATTTTGRFTTEEKAAMRAAAQERKAATGKAEGEAAALAAIAEMPDPDRGMAGRIHELIKTAAPSLSARTWYGMPAYATQDGRIILAFKPASKFKTRYATLEFQHDASLDDGPMWPVSWAVAGLTPEVEARIAALVTRAVG